MRVPARPNVAVRPGVTDGGDIVGRDAEQQQIGAFLGDAPAGPRALLLRGPAGIGKTTLWRWAVEQAAARGYRVLAARPSEPESVLAFAGLADLVGPEVLGSLERLASPQRRALEMALLLTPVGPEEPVDEHRAVASAFLGLLRLLAEEGPILIAIDDIQWLDDETTAVFHFAARRLQQEAVAFLLSARLVSSDAGPHALLRTFDGDVHQVHVDPLSMGALRHVVARHTGRSLPRPLLHRIWDESGGNPFYALQVAHALVHQRARLRPGERLPVPSDLGRLLAERIARLPRPTRDVLELVAGAATATIAELDAATDGAVRAAVQPAVDDGVVEIVGAHIRFVHPLMTSAVYAGMVPSRRRSVHARLAVTLDGEEGIRHLALSVAEPDGAVAAAVEEQAGRVRARGAPAAAADLCEQAVGLTPPDDVVGTVRRQVLAARFHFESGDSDRALQLLTDAAVSVAPGEARGHVLARLARIHMYRGDQRRAVALFEEAILEAGDASMARADAEEGLATALYLMRERLPAAAEHAARAVAILQELGDRSELAAALATLGLIQGVMGRPETPDTLRQASLLERSAERRSPAGDQRVMRRPAFALGAISLWRDDGEGAMRHLESGEHEVRVHGDDSSLLWFLSYRALAEYLIGAWDDALASAQRALEVAVEVGQRPGHAVALSARAIIGASRGDRTAADDIVAVTELLGDEPAMLARINAAWAGGLLDLSRGRPRAAHDHLGPVIERVRDQGVAEPGSIRLVTDDVEALVGSDRPDEARSLLDWVEGMAEDLGRQSVLATCHRGRALLAAADGDLRGAQDAIGAALGAHRRCLVPFDHGRTLLLQGSLLRRSGSKRESRVVLEEARAIFDGLGARPWSRVASAELASIGGRTASGTALTTAEERVARLVADGLSNREVAAALFLSPRTVEYHLSNVYAKLGLPSRSALVSWMAARDRGAST